jgi:tRNA nucleotidyltransferase (CCA-adding enzyme)
VAVEVRKAINEIGEDIFPLYLEVQKADMEAQSTYRREEKRMRQEGVCRVYHEIVERGECVSLKNLAVSGNDLISIGVRPGRQIGEILDSLLEKVLEDPGLNEKELLLSIVTDLLTLI